MLNRLLQRIGLYMLSRKIPEIRRSRKMWNLTHARHIGILYSLNDTSDYNLISVFVSELQQAGKVVKAMGFVRNKELVKRFLPKLSYDFYSRQDLNWFLKPVCKTVRDFIQQEFDLLIDLSLQEHLSLKFIAGLSKSQCKVGRFSEDNTPYFDMMIEAKPFITLNEYIDQIRHYLTIIKQHA